MGGNLFCWEEGLPTFPAGATVADADLGATSGAMDMYDEFGNYIGPELSDEDSEGAAGGDQEEVRLATRDAPRAPPRDRIRRRAPLFSLGDFPPDVPPPSTPSPPLDSISPFAQDDDWMDQAERAAEARDAAGAGGMDADMDDDAYENPETAVVLAEDKKYYPTAEEVYGEGTETLVMDEDAQPLEEPIIAPLKHKRVELREREALEMKVRQEYLVDMTGNPNLVRSVAVAGHLHHGKTTFMDMLVEQTHEVGFEWFSDDKQLRYTDTRIDERDREVSVKAVPMSLVMPTSAGKHLLFNLMDTPGHVNFSDEVTASYRLADAVLLVVDAAEGLMQCTERLIKHAARENLPVVVFVNKIDRLVLELKLPPADAYHKIKHVLEEINAVIEASYGADGGDCPFADPVRGTVCFGSALYGWSFTLESFARLYAKARRLPDLDVKKFAARLWGDVYFHDRARTFKKKPPPEGGERSFVQFILEPLYKIYSQAVGEDAESFAAALAEFGVALKPKAFEMNAKPLLKLACRKVFGDASGLVDMLAAHCPTTREGARAKVERAYAGPLVGDDGPDDAARAMRECDAAGPLRVMISKLYPKDDCSSFDALGRVMSGTLRKGQRVRVLGEAYSPDDEEDCAVRAVTGLWVYQARYRIPIEEARAGNWVLIEGVDGSVSKTATLADEAPRSRADEAFVFKPLAFDNRAVIKIATEPLNPSDLPKMVEGLRKINKSYPLAVTKVEESGEHTIMGTGELFLDSAMKDLRELFGEVEVKVADPVVTFCETVVETSSLKCFAETPNGRNKLTMIAEPLDKGLASDVESGAVSLAWPRKKLGDFFRSKYDWDILAARSVWAFGPDECGPNALLDDTLPGEVDKGLLNAVRDSVVQGFRWGAREGPLCDEPIRDVKFKILDAVVADQPLHRGGGQMIPTARRAAYAAFLTASPRLMEPVLSVEIQTPADCVSAIYNVLSKRRGHVVSDAAVPGTPTYAVKALLPAIESFGFETDLRYHTQGQAFGMSVFDHWAVVPGDPLDRSVQLRPLEPAPVQHLAREFMVKTRRRKGMSEDVSVNKFFDDHLLMELAKADADIVPGMKA